MRYKLGRCLLDDRLNDAGMTRAELEEKTMYPRQRLSDWAAKRKKMSLETALTIAENLGCGVRDLYDLIPVKRSVPQRQSKKKTD